MACPCDSSPWAESTERALLGEVMGSRPIRGCVTPSHKERRSAPTFARTLIGEWVRPHRLALGEGRTNNMGKRSAISIGAIAAGVMALRAQTWGARETMTRTGVGGGDLSGAVDDSRE